MVHNWGVEFSSQARLTPGVFWFSTHPSALLAPKAGVNDGQSDGVDGLERRWTGREILLFRFAREGVENPFISLHHHQSTACHTAPSLPGRDTPSVSNKMAFCLDSRVQC